MASIEDRWFEEVRQPDGSTVKRPTDRNGAGLRWRVRYRTPEGASRNKSFRTKVEAEDFVTSLRVALRDRTFVDPARSKITVGDMAEKWVAAKVNLKPSTKSRYDNALRVHVLPRWASTPLSRVDHEDVQAWVAELVADGKSGSSVRKIHGVLLGILQLAVRAKRIPANPALEVDLPSAASRGKKYLTVQQVEQLAAAASTLPAGRPRRLTDAAFSQYRLVVLVLAYCGLRWSELAALRTSSVDLMRRRILVEAAVVEVDGSILVWGTPKSGKARTVRIPPFLVDDLRDLLAGKAPTDLVFTSPDGDVLRNRNARRAWFDRAATSIGVAGLTPHELRHTAASLAVSAGANVKAVQRMLGHASAAMTLDRYSDLFDDDLEAVAERLDALRTAALVSPACPEGQVVELRPNG